MMVRATTIEVARGNLHNARAVTGTMMAGVGQVLFAIDHFALTSNNMTYAAHGVDLRYWDFYPASDAGQGIVPVWGFATAVESGVAGIAAGDRFYGYWPMASHAVLTPGQVSARGFADVSAHRAGLATVYNSYDRASPATGDERAYALIRPLYATSFLIDDTLSEVPGIDIAVLASASSKTALGLAQALSARGGRTVIGLTSARNRAFTEATGYYDRVLTYDAVAELADVPTAFVDFAGDAVLRRDVHVRLGDALKLSMIIGDTHWDSAPPASADLPGPQPALFFAPTQFAKRLADWGPAAFNARLAAAWAGFLGTAGWLRIVEERGANAAITRWADFAAGRVDAAEGVVLRLG